MGRSRRTSMPTAVGVEHCATHKAVAHQEYDCSHVVRGVQLGRPDAHFQRARNTRVIIGLRLTQLENRTIDPSGSICCVAYSTQWCWSQSLPSNSARAWPGVYFGLATSQCSLAVLLQLPWVCLSACRKGRQKKTTSAKLAQIRPAIFALSGCVVSPSLIAMCGRPNDIRKQPLISGKRDRPLRVAFCPSHERPHPRRSSRSVAGR
ncbi:hypothetical protein QFZ96_002687 [Paraburkholderia youngii]